MNIEALRQFANSLPHVTEDIKWGNDLCFCIAEKMFFVTGLSHQCTASIKVQPEEFEALCSRDGIVSAPYIGRYKWVLVTGEDSLSEKEWKHYIAQSYALVKAKLPKKLQKELDA